MNLCPRSEGHTADSRGGHPAGKLLFFMPQHHVSPTARRARRWTAAATSLGLLALTGSVFSGPAIAAVPTFTLVAQTVSTSQADPIDEIVVDAQSALADAREATVAAERITTAVAEADVDLDAADAKVDTSELREHIERLEPLDVLPTMFLPELTEAAVEETESVRAEVAQVQARLDTAEAEKKAAEEEAARKAEEEAAAAAAAEEEAARQADNTSPGDSGSGGAPAPAPMPASVPVDPGSAQAIAQEMAAANYGWGDDQFGCLVALWNRESGWNAQAMNPSSGAYGIPQALPGDKMASAGGDWQTNPATQIAWGLSYIAGRYGDPCGAWGHSEATGWY